MIKILKRIINKIWYAFEISMMIKLIILVFIPIDQFQCTLVRNTKMLNEINTIWYNLMGQSTYDDTYDNFK